MGTADHRPMEMKLPGEADRGSSPSQLARDLLVMALAAFGLGLIGIISRPAGYLAAFWIANPVLLGLLVRVPRLIRPVSGLGIALGLLAADLMTGNDFVSAIVLTTGNLIFVAVGVAVFRYVPETDKRLQLPRSILVIGLVTASAALGASLFGAVVSSLFIDRDISSGWFGWFSSEFANGMTILPVILAAPARERLLSMFPTPRARPRMSALWPLLLLVASLATGILVAGPGALAFGIPALMWCALRGDVFQTSVLCLVALVVMLSSLSFDSSNFGITDEDEARSLVVSLQLGLALMCMGPIATASATSMRLQELHQARRVAARDGLTGALTRNAFYGRGETMLEDLAEADRPVAIAMLDVDHFKVINDSHGHAAGDQVLIDLIKAVSYQLRDTDLVGRAGGEEFAIIMPGVSRHVAWAVGEGIRRMIEIQIRLGNETERLPGADESEKSAVTVSIGLAWTPAVAGTLEDALKVADEALYTAKEQRNRVVLFDWLNESLVPGGEKSGVVS